MNKNDFLDLIEEYGEQMYHLRTVRSWNNPKYEDEINDSIEELTKKIKNIVNNVYVEWVCPVCDACGADVQMKNYKIHCKCCNAVSDLER